jgi:hypothetical protein
VEGNGGNETNVWPPAFSDDVDNDNRSEAHEHAEDEVNKDSYWPSSQDDTSTGTPSSSSLSDGSEEDEPIRVAESYAYEPDRDGFNVMELVMDNMRERKAFNLAEDDCHLLYKGSSYTKRDFHELYSHASLVMVYPTQQK